jgi:hypothetical protein
MRSPSGRIELKLPSALAIDGLTFTQNLIRSAFALLVAEFQILESVDSQLVVAYRSFLEDMALVATMSTTTQLRPISSLGACSEFVSPGADLSQVAFADGTIRDADLKTYPDLFWALRGGGNNFGIVTRFDLNTFPQGDLWGGNVYWSYDNSAALLQALEDFNNNHATDPYGAVILAYRYIPAQDTFLIVSQLEYGKPVVNLPILQNLTKIPSIGGTMRISNLTGLTEELFGPPGFR